MVDVHETRQLGAMGLIVNKQTGEVLAIKDKSKVELSAGVRHAAGYYFEKPASRLNTFAGGRQGNESARQTVYRESIEETKENLHAPKTGMQIDADTPQSFMPFVVGQLDYKNSQINETAVTVFFKEWQKLGKRMKYILAREAGNGNAQWFDSSYLFHLRSENGSSDELTRFRPQFITAASLFLLQELTELRRDDLTYLVGGWNRSLLSFLLGAAETSNMSVNNGTFQENGNLKPRLPRKITNYLAADYLYE